jgi:protein involved in polysaccharide export with SLBB domain
MAMKLGAAVFTSIVLSLVATAATTRAADVPASVPASAPAAAKLRVHVVGRVKHPGTLQLDAGARLSDALTAAGADFEKLIARVGGEPVPDTDCVLGGPSLRQVYLTRTTETSKPATYAIDVSMARQQHDVRYDPLLRDDDRIFVPQCRPKVKVILTPPTFPTPLNG